MNTGIAIGYAPKHQRTVGEAKAARMEEIVRAKLSRPSEAERIKAGYRTLERTGVPSSDRFSKSQVEAQMLLLARSKARRDAGKRADEGWGK